MKDNDLLASVSDTSTESEFFVPIPPGYKKGKTRYCFVMGTVMSGLGKGIFRHCFLNLSSFCPACAFISLPYFNPCGIFYI